MYEPQQRNHRQRHQHHFGASWRPKHRYQLTEVRHSLGSAADPRITDHINPAAYGIDPINCNAKYGQTCRSRDAAKYSLLALLHQK